MLILFFPAGLFLMWKYASWNTKVKWGVTGFFGLMLFVSALNGSSTSKTATTASDQQTTTTQQVTTPQPTETPKATDTPAPTPTPIAKDANGFPMDAEKVTVSDLDKAPSQYEGKRVTFTCTVAGFAKDSSGNAAAVNCSDPNDYSSLVQVSTQAFDMTKINQSDTIRFYGLGGGAAQGKNAFGGQVSETVVEAIYINDLTSGYKE